MISISIKSFQAIIFDFDGVIADTEYLHYLAFQKILAKYDMEYVPFEEHCKQFGGRGSRYIMTYYIEKYQKNLKASKLIGEKVDLFISLCDQNGVEPIKGVIDFVYKLKQRDLKIAISTGSNKKTIDHVLKLAQVPEIFEVITTSNDISKPKPDPNGFLITAQKLGMDPKDCLIFEDALNGIQAAKAAGMDYIAVASCIPKDKFLEFDSNIQIINDFTEVNLI